MGIEKPYEVETGELSWAPGPPRRAPFEARMRELIRPHEGGVLLAGRVLRVASGDPSHVARDLAHVVAMRMEDRRPDADEHTWRHFADLVHSLAKDHDEVDPELYRVLIETVDGL